MNARDAMIILAALALAVGCAADSTGGAAANAVGGPGGGAAVDPSAVEAQLRGNLGEQANIEGGVYDAYQNYDQYNLSFSMFSRGSGWAAMNAVNIWSPDGTLAFEVGDHIVLTSPWEGDLEEDEPLEEEPLEDGTIPPEQAGDDLEGEVIGCSGDTPDYDFDEPADDVVIDVEECDDPEMLRLVYTASFSGGDSGVVTGSFLIPREPGVATDDLGGEWGGDWGI